MISKDQIRNAVDFKLKTIPVPEWGGDLCIRQWTPFEFADYLDQCGKTPSVMDSWVTSLILSACDESGNLILDESDRERLTQKNREVLSRIFDEIITFNGYKADSIEQKKSD